MKVYGVPVKPQDLGHNNCILFTRLAEYTGNTNAWQYQDPNTGKTVDITVSGNYLSRPIIHLWWQAALDGIGIYQGPNWMFGDDIVQGRMIETLSEYHLDPFPIYLIFPMHDYLPLRLNVLIDYLRHEFSLNPWVASIE